MAWVELNQNFRAIEFYERDGLDNSRLGHADREAYWRDGIGIDPQIVDWAFEGLKRLDPKVGTVRCDNGRGAGAANAPKVELALVTKDTIKPGGDQRSETGEGGSSYQ